MTMHDAKAQAVDAFAAFTGVPLPENPAQALRSIRRQAKEEIELLIAFLDSTESDPDFEEADPLEDDAPCEDVGDDEPSLGAPGTFMVQTKPCGRRALTTTGKTKASYSKRMGTANRRSARRRR